ncbi:RNA polymerase sigma-70 factor [Chitinophaga sp. MM2321]|uniref:RNA polymerase sigma factor n=1 Tax=Chitinophaga sp. MM2321 TaxID=3137178 RepID=UPI0032D5AF34
MRSDLYNEKELMQQAAQDSEAAFTTLFHLYKSRLYGYILRLTDSPEMAEDVVQDVFMKLWKNRAGLVEIDHFRGYLFRMAQHHAINAFKRMAAETLLLADKSLQPDTIMSNAEEVLELKDVQQLLHKAVAKLPPQQKLVYTLSREQGLKHEEIAASLRISHSTVNKHMVQALRTIREQLRNYAGSPGSYYILFIIAAAFNK